VADIALSPAALARLADSAPVGHWVADPFDAASGLSPRVTLGDATAVAAADLSGAGWFM
jgi:hypothetical protein